MLALNDAIKHYREKAEELRKEASLMPDYSEDKEPCLEYANEQEQVADWLEELKRYKECGCVKDECFNCGGCDNGR